MEQEPYKEQATAWHNPILSVNQLAKYTGFKASWLSESIARDVDPLPTLQRSKHHRVLYSDFCEWIRRNYGPGGARRGQEKLNPEL